MSVTNDAKLDGSNALFEWEWSAPARAAFFRAASPAGGGRMRVSAGMNAALDYDGPALLAAALERLVVNLGNHPDLGQRVLELRPGPDGLVHLPVDEDLLRLVIFNTLPGGVAERWASEAEDHQLEIPLDDGSQSDAKS